MRMHGNHDRHGTWWRSLLVGALCASMLAACGGALSDEEILAANGAQPGSGSGTAIGTGGADAPSAVAGQTPTTGASGAEGGPTGAAPGGGAGPAATAGGGAEGGGPAGQAIGTPGETGPIIVGSVGNYSGPAGSSQADVPKGVQLWAAAVNASGGLFGRSVQVIVADDGGDPARYASLVRDFVENRGVVAFVGQAASLSMDGGLDYLKSKGIPVVGTECSRDEWFESETFFPQCSNLDALAGEMIRTGLRLSGENKLGVVYCGEVKACTDFDERFQRLAAPQGAELVYRAQISVAQVDFTANCQNAQAAGVKVMIVAGDANTLARFARSCDRQGFRPQYSQASISVTPGSIKEPGLSTVALVTTTFPFVGASGGAIDEYNAAVDAFGGGVRSPATALGWAAAKLFELGAVRAAQASGSVSPATLVAGLHTIKGETLGGLTVPLDFSGPTPNNASCNFVMQGDGNGSWALPFGPAAQCP